VRLKPGVDLRGMQSPILLAINVAAFIYEKHGYELVVTSVTDGQHMQGSLHDKGLAADLRISNIKVPDVVEAIAEELRAALGKQFDVVLETDHLHVEFDPKDPVVPLSAGAA
jgi:hypothetical protein